MEKVVNTFMAIIRSAIMETNEDIDVSHINYEALLSLSKFHDLAHVIYYELNKRIENWEGDTHNRFKQQYDNSIYRFVKRDLAIEQVKEAFEMAHIDYILLKGSYLLKLYPQPWMRTSSDVDVLVRKEDIDRAIVTLNKKGFVQFLETSKDISFYTPEHYHIELHHSLMEEGIFDNANQLLNTIWDCVEPNVSKYEKYMSGEMIYFYHVVHMAKHFKNGGCGVRFFIDLWLLNHTISFDNDKRVALIKSSGLDSFEKKVRLLSEKWFSRNEDFSDIQEIEKYIFEGGTYGNLDHSAAIRKNNARNMLLYYMRRVFQPYCIMKNSYPKLRKYPILLPFFWVARWFNILDPKVRRNAKNEIKIIRGNTNEQIELLFNELEI
ncbi:MAG: nucleotidyltransferase family protein [Clostridia bacterium]|nr:nucleotidyltransferase family protein [Clostridia bacterium]